MADPHKDWREAHDAFCLEAGYCFTPGQSDASTLSRIAGLKAIQRLLPPDPDAMIPMILHCPQCGERHIDEGEFADKPHHTHACQGCGFVWRPAKVNTHGVQFLPGYKNEGQQS
jgi:hypothetical protein